jgi:quercetin dioxygenase-like cupin family protein
VKIRLRDHARWGDDKLQKIALATTPRVQIDLYCAAPGQSQKPHTHGDQDKIYVVLEGRGRFTVDGTEEVLAAGEAVLAPAGAEHGVVNDGAERLLVLVMVSPPARHQAGGERPPLLSQAPPPARDAGE